MSATLGAIIMAQRGCEMPRCIPIKEIKNTTEFARIVEESPEPVIVTRNGREAFAAMSIELLDAMRMERARAELYRLLDEAEEESRRGGLYLTERGISEKSFSLFGYDAGVIMPYLMNVVPVRPGEAIYIQSGVLHSYAHGTGIGIEDSSDNEIRLSLSRKHKDIQGALNLIDFDSSFSGKVCLKPDSVLRSVASTPTFALAVLSSGSYDIREKTPCFSLCLEGLARVGTPDDHIMLREGECCFIPSCDEEYHVRVSGKVYQALFSADEE